MFLIESWDKAIDLDSNQTVVSSDGGAQKLGNDVWHDSESLQPRFPAKLVANEM